MSGVRTVNRIIILLRETPAKDIGGGFYNKTYKYYYKKLGFVQRKWYN